MEGMSTRALPRPVTVGVGPLTIDEVVAVARHDAAVVLDPAALVEVARSREIQLQRSLVRSHAAGSGPEVEREVVRALMLLRISTLATGRTGVREATLAAYVGMLNAGIAPVVHEFGSLGCSGDLAPLSHCALALMGEGFVRDATGERVQAAQALAAAGLTPIELQEKEGLALINGTDGILGMLCLALHDLSELARLADVGRGTVGHR